MDVIGIHVERVLDGDTFTGRVIWVADESPWEYNEREVIRLRKGNAPALEERGGKAAKRALEKLILNQEVEVAVYSRIRGSRLVGELID